MSRVGIVGTILLFFVSDVIAAELDAVIQVHADRTIARISPFTTGACIEDVNHEIYGGLYSQMVFGESFQEPPITQAPPGFSVYGGAWHVTNGEVVAAAGDGPKLIHQQTKLSDGEASVEILFPDKTPGNAGLILRVDRPAVGADHFTGYEIALYPENGTLLLGRHRQNWEPITTVPCPVPINEWIPLKVQLKGRSITVTVHGQVQLQYEDNQHPLLEGQVGLRTWRREARFRNLSVIAGDRSEQIALKDSPTSVDAVSGMWRAVRRGNCHGEITLEKTGFVGQQSQRITLKTGDGEVGVENRGLNRWGMNFVAGKPYEVVVWAKTDRSAKIAVAFEGRSERPILAEAQATVKEGDWQRLELTLTPSETDSRGKLVVSLKQPGSVVLGYVSVQPGTWGRFKGLPVRKDVSEALMAQGLTVLRYGGSMVNCPEYRWKQMIGPRDRRQPYKGTWYPYSTNGWGIIDFISFCEAAGFLSIPDLNMDETPRDMADFVEYINGPADSEWGRHRVADGHPAPFGLKYIQLGNEEAVNDVYWQKFKPLVEAIWSRDPNIIPIVGDFAYGQPIKDPYDFPGAPSIKSLAAHKKILDFAHQHGKSVWFDVHIWNDGLRDADPQIEVLGGLIDWLGKLSPGADFRVCVFEENSNNHLWRRGLAHARTVNRLQRFGDKVPIVCAANCLQPVGQNDNGWDQGLVFLSPSHVWPQSSAHVTRMISENKFPRCIATECRCPNDALDVTSRISDDGKVLVLQVVNSENRPISTRLNITGFVPAGKVSKISQIAGHLDERNLEIDPDRIVATDRVWYPEFDAAETTYVVPPQSFSILRFE